MTPWRDEVFIWLGASVDATLAHQLDGGLRERLGYLRSLEGAEGAGGGLPAKDDVMVISSAGDSYAVGYSWSLGVNPELSSED